MAGVALAMGSAGLSSEIKIANPLERSIVADLSVAAMGGVVRGRIDVENLAIQLISDSARYAVQQSYANSSPDEYHQSQKASRGEGHITQTTVDQQWDAHLINDAEFTANTPLPSVTLDSNNAQLGQRVGEEVSHFYHPTPPPPRNPSGFWQRVEQQYKNSFERQALIAEGRASAYSEVMRESVGHAAANEQNYLDLGYTESNAQYGAAWIAMSGVPATKTIRLGIQATRLLAENKWGFFSHNGAESLAEVKMLASPRDFYLSKIENPKLYRIIDRLYRPNAKYGTGSTADAVRHEISGKEFLSKSSHIQKAVESRNALSTLIHADQQLSLSDKQIALWVREDLQNALTEQPWDKVYIGRQGMRP